MHKQSQKIQPEGNTGNWLDASKLTQNSSPAPVGKEELGYSVLIKTGAENKSGTEFPNSGAPGFGIDVWLKDPGCVGYPGCAVAGFENAGAILYNGNHEFACIAGVHDNRAVTSWHQASASTPVNIACTSDGAKIELWVNGTRVESKDLAFNPAQLGRMTLGGTYTISSSTSYFTGEVFALRVWSSTAAYESVTTP